MQSPAELQVKIEQRLRTMRVLWFAILAGIVVFFFFTRFTERPAELELNNAISIALIVVALSTIPVSFVVKKMLLAKSVKDQEVGMVQQAYVVAWAISEGAALLGLFDFFVTANPYYFLPMLIAAVGELLHFPQRQHVVDASFKR